MRFEITGHQAAGPGRKIVNLVIQVEEELHNLSCRVALVSQCFVQQLQENDRSELSDRSFSTLQHFIFGAFYVDFYQVEAVEAFDLQELIQAINLYNLNPRLLNRVGKVTQSVLTLVAVFANLQL